MKLRICGVDIDVRKSIPGIWSANGMGRSCQVESEILLRADLKKDQMFAVLLHEVIHLICDMNNLTKVMDDESAISVLTNCIMAFLRDNDLLKEIEVPE